MKKKILFLILFGLGLFLSLNMNSKYKPFTYKSTMWADASGYYMYLPATIIYQWDYSKMPAGIDTLTGRGFSLVEQNKTIYTKYTNGIALLQLPFFTLVHTYTLITNGKADGFSQNYINGILFSGVFYLILGLFFLYSFLQHYFSKIAALITSISIVLCSNLYFYGIEHNGLTHVYSFFIISFILYHICYLNPKKIFFLIPAVALLILIRPTNALFALPLFIYFVYNWKHRQCGKFNIYSFIISSLLACVIFIPQLVYWKYASGSTILYSYENEGFIYWGSPKIASVLFAPRNGFFVFAPILAFALWGFYYRPINKGLSAAILLTFCVLTYINASWWCWFFGCAYGARAFIEIYPFLCIGLAQTIDKLKTSHKTIQYLGISIIFLFAVYNLLLIYGYDDCWYSSEWDYAYLLKILKG